MENRIKLACLLSGGATEDVSYHTLVSLCLDMCEKFKKHSKNGNYLLYSDENAVLCDLDSGTVDGSSLAASSMIEEGGARTASFKYIAPEILRGEEANAYEAGLYTLAVLLFRLLTLSFPFEGEKFAEVGNSDEELSEFYRSNPAFVFDKSGDNRARFGAQDTVLAYWEIYPDYLKKAFTDTFTQGGARLTEDGWIDILSRLSGQLSVCTDCGAEMFYASHPAICWRCRKCVMPLVIKLRSGDRTVMRTIAACGIMRSGRGYKFETVVRGMRWGIKNHGPDVWRWIKPDGRVVEVEAGKAVPFRDGLKIRLTDSAQLTMEIEKERGR